MRCQTYFRRSLRKGRLSTIKVSSKRKIRKSVDKKRKVESKIGRKSTPKENSKTSKSTKQASFNLKINVNKGSEKKTPEIGGFKRNTRNSLNASQFDLSVSDASLQNHPDEKKISKKLVSHKKQSDYKSFRGSELLSSTERKASQKKSSIGVTNLRSKSVLTPNPASLKSKPIKRKSARLSTAALNQEISVNTPTCKSVILTPVPKITSSTKLTKNKKSVVLPKERNPIIPMNSEGSLCTYSFQSLLDTPLPEKHSEKIKSSRLLQSYPLRTQNKEPSLCTLTSLKKRSPDAFAKKSSKSNEKGHALSFESRGRKRSRSNLDVLTFSQEKAKRNPRRQVCVNQETSENLKKPLPHKSKNLPIDVLTTPAFKPVHARTLSKKYLSKSDTKSSTRKLKASLSENHVASEEFQVTKQRKSADFLNLPGKGTLKRKRWLLNNLKEKNGSYEDDIFENQSFNLYKPAFQFGDETDGSSIVNIATPKFDCVLTPALPKRTPKFKDCISPTDLLQARKSAEEYLYRRNKKRKSGDRASSSEKETTMNKKKVQDIPEKKKLDFKEAVNKLVEIQKNLEIQAEVNDEEEDSYFSDVSN